jgi:hypothetical protein
VATALAAVSMPLLVELKRKKSSRKKLKKTSVLLNLLKVKDRT